MHKATVPLHLLFLQQAALSESWKHSNNLRMSFFFTQKSVKCYQISLGILLMQTLYITNVCFFPLEQYFIDTLESILK